MVNHVLQICNVILGPHNVRNGSYNDGGAYIHFHPQEILHCNSNRQLTIFYSV